MINKGSKCNNDETQNRNMSQGMQNGEEKNNGENEIKDSLSFGDASELYARQHDAASDDEDFQHRGDELHKLKDELNKKNDEIAALKDLLMRRQADFDNYKKRVIRMQEEDRKMAVKDIALDVITVNDHLMRAIDAADSVAHVDTLSDAHNSFIDGVKMISRQIEDVLKRHGIEEINSLNTAFDPECNEAVEMDESEEIDHDTVTKIYLKGFKLDKYVIRAARVKVTRPAKKNSKNSTAEENTTVLPH